MIQAHYLIHIIIYTTTRYPLSDHAFHNARLSRVWWIKHAFSPQACSKRYPKGMVKVSYMVSLAIEVPTSLAWTWASLRRRRRISCWARAMSWSFSSRREKNPWYGYILVCQQKGKEYAHTYIILVIAMGCVDWCCWSWNIHDNDEVIIFN